MKELTRAEDQIMRVLWELGRGFVKDIRERLPDPKPAYNTVSTIIRILESKGFVSHRAFGKTHEYYPVLSRKDYTSYLVNTVVRNYFDNSFQEMVSFFAKGKKLSLLELEEIMDMIGNEIRRKKGRP